MNLVPLWDKRSSWSHRGAHRAPVPTHPPPSHQPSPTGGPGGAQPSPSSPGHTPARSVPTASSACTGSFAAGQQGGELGGLGEPGGEGWAGKAWPCPHPVATEPGRDEDLALAHQLVLGPAPPAPKHLLDEGGELGHALLAPPLQVEQLGTTMAITGSLSSSRGCSNTQELPG